MGQAGRHWALGPVVIAFLREELRAQPFRATRALRLSTIAILSLTVSLTVDLVTGFGAFLVVVCIAPDFSYGWKHLLRRLLVVLCVMIVSVPIVGVLVQVPWFALPVVFSVLAIGGSLLPTARFTLEWMTVKFTVVALLFAAQFEPGSIGPTAATLFWSAAIPLTTATVFSQLVWPEGARELLDASIAATFEEIREGLRRARMSLFGATQPYRGVASQLAGHLALLERLRRESDDARRDRLYASIAVLAERASHEAARLEYLATELRGAHPYVEQLRDEILAVLDPLDGTVAVYAAHFARLEESDPPSTWPDLRQRLRRLDARRDVVAADGRWYAALGVEDTARLNDAFEAMRSLSERFRDPPAAFHDLVAPEVVPAIAAPTGRDPTQTRFSIRAAAAATVAYVVASASQHPQLETTIWTTLHASQFTHGATIRKMLLRAAGSVLGGALAILMMIAVLPNTVDIGIYLVSIFVVLVPLYYTALGGPRIAYLGTQATISFLLAYLASAQASGVGEPLWRVFTILLGDVVLYATFWILGPELASEKIQPVLAGLDEAMRELLPGGSEPLDLTRETQLARKISTTLEQAAILADEARFEAGSRAVDAQAVLEYVALSRRMLGRLQAIHDLRRTGRVQPPPTVGAATDEVERSLAALLSDSPGGEADDLLEQALAALRSGVEAARPWIAGLPADRRSRVYSELDQFDRLATLCHLRREARLHIVPTDPGVIRAPAPSRG